MGCSSAQNFAINFSYFLNQLLLLVFFDLIRKKLKISALSLSYSNYIKINTFIRISIIVLNFKMAGKLRFHHHPNPIKLILFLALEQQSQNQTPYLHSLNRII